MSAIEVADSELIERIRACATALLTEAHEVSTVLLHYAKEIDEPETRECAVRQFDELARHWKGLRDVIVPGISTTEWEKQVHVLSEAAHAAIKARTPSWRRRWFS
jgi:hypothetical protein